MSELRAKAEAVAPARRGLMLVMSSPSGAGKTTLSRQLLAEDDGIELSISVTTRPRRLSERDGKDYHFIDAETYGRMVRNDELLEHAQVFGNCYGTPRGPVEAALRAGRDVLFDIDWQGTQQLVQRVPDDLVTVFILPPSFEELERRLHRRAEDSDEIIRIRMVEARDEISHFKEYDYIVVNHDLEQAFAGVRSILAAERLKRVRQTTLPAFIESLCAER